MARDQYIQSASIPTLSQNNNYKATIGNINLDPSNIVNSKGNVVNGINNTISGINNIINGNNHIVNSSNNFITGNNHIVNSSNNFITGNNHTIISDNNIILGGSNLTISNGSTASSIFANNINVSNSIVDRTLAVSTTTSPLVSTGIYGAVLFTNSSALVNITDRLTLDWFFTTNTVGLTITFQFQAQPAGGGTPAQRTIGSFAPGTGLISSEAVINIVKSSATSVRATLSVNNVITITDVTGIDPSTIVAVGYTTSAFTGTGDQIMFIAQFKGAPILQ